MNLKKKYYKRIKRSECKFPFGCISLDKKDPKDFIKRKHQMIKLIDRREERKAIGQI